MKKQQKRTILVLTRMLKMAQDDESFAEMFDWGLDSMLNDIAKEDGFGPECQEDPRGDATNNGDNLYSINFVEGIDD